MSKLITTYNWFGFLLMISKALVTLVSNNSPDQKSMDKLLLLLQVAWPVPLDVSVELILQRVAAVLHVEFAHLKNRQCSAMIKWREEEKGATGKAASKGCCVLGSICQLRCDVAMLFI